jgi:glutamine cyclotransferase
VGSGSAPTYSFVIVNVYPHDPDAFTQGLLYDDGWLYESTGRRGQSSVRRVEVETGNVEQVYALPEQLFGEGLTLFGDRLIQLTWKSQVGFVYDQETFDLEWVFEYPTQGWGITHDGERLIMSDGTSTLYFWDPQTLAEIGQVQVQADGCPIDRLNELEYVEGEVWANVWLTDTIARIDPQDGRVTGWIDLGGLLDRESLGQPADVLNGIAYDAEGGRLFVTGKLWPSLFEIQLVPET